MLTPAQTRTLQFIENYFATHQHAPKLLEVAHGIGIQSKGTVSRYINTLVQAGYLTKARNRHRGLQPINARLDANNSIALIAPGSKFTQFSQCLSMHIKDDSLKDQGFYKGDTLWYQANQEARVGDVVMAYLDKSTPMIKQVHALHGDFISLSCPHLQNKPRAYVNARIEIYGIVKGWVRNFIQEAL